MIKAKFSSGDYIKGPAYGKLYRVLGLCRYIPDRGLCYALKEEVRNEIHVIPVDEVNHKFFKLKESQ